MAVVRSLLTAKIAEFEAVLTEAGQGAVPVRDANTNVVQRMAAFGKQRLEGRFGVNLGRFGVTKLTRREHHDGTTTVDAEVDEGAGRDEDLGVAVIHPDGTRDIAVFGAPGENPDDPDLPEDEPGGWVARQAAAAPKRILDAVIRYGGRTAKEWAKTTAAAALSGAAVGGIAGVAVPAVVAFAVGAALTPATIKAVARLVAGLPPADVRRANVNTPVESDDELVVVRPVNRRKVDATRPDEWPTAIENIRDDTNEAIDQMRDQAIRDGMPEPEANMNRTFLRSEVTGMCQSLTGICEKGKPPPTPTRVLQYEGGPEQWVRERWRGKEKRVAGDS